jgi:hypothetical protein
MQAIVPVPERVLIDLLAHAASAAHLLGHLDSADAALVADHLDAIVHEISEVLGSPRESAASAAPGGLAIMNRDDLGPDGAVPVSMVMVGGVL